MAEGDDAARRLVLGDRVIEYDTPEAAERALAEAPERIRSRLVRDTPELAAARARRAEFGDRPIAAGAAGVARGATLGLSDLGVRAVSDDAADYLAALEEANPEASMAGDVVGSVAPVLLTGGEALGARGLLAGAARTIGAPTRLLAGASEAIGGAVGRRLGGGLLGRAAAVGTEGAIEGLVGEGGRLLSEAALGDPDLSAEMILSRLSTGGLGGALTGGLLGGAGAAFARGGRAVGDGLASLTGRAWRDTVGTELSPTVARVWGALSGREPGDIARFTGLGAEGRRLRRLVASGDAAIESGTRDIGAAMSAMETARAGIARRWREGLRLGEVESLADPSLLAVQAESARTLAAAMRDRVELLATDFERDALGGTARGILRSVDRRMTDIELAIERNAGARSSSEINNALNGIKREVDALVARSRGYGPAADALSEANNRIRSSLEDASIWGEGVANAQRTINEAFTRELTTRNAFARNFLENGGTLSGRADWNPFEVVPQADSARVAAFLGRLGVAANDTVETTFRESVDSTRRLLDAFDSSLNLDAADRAAIAEARRAYRSLTETFSRVERDATDLNQWRRLSAGGSLERSLVGGTVGSAVGGPVGALAGAALAAPAQAVRTLGILERWTSGVSEEMSEGISRALRSARESAAAAARPIRSATVLASVNAYQERTRRLDEETRDISAVTRRLAANTRDLDGAPATRDSLMVAATRANAYLNTVRPRVSSMAGELVADADRVPSRSEVATFNSVARVVDDPLSVLDDMRDGSLTETQVDALRSVYPRLYAAMRSEVVRQVSEAGDDIPYRSRLSLSVFLGAPTVPSLVPALMAQMQSAYVVAPSPPPTRPPHLANGLASGTDALEMRRSPA